MFHWHGFPSDLDRKAEFAYLVSILPDTPPVTRTLVAYGLVSRLWAHAATCADEDGKIVTRQNILDAYLGLEGASSYLFDAAYLDGEFPGVIVVGWSEMNHEHGRRRAEVADRQRRCRESRKSKANQPQCHVTERDISVTVTHGHAMSHDVTPTGQDRTSQDEDEPEMSRDEPSTALRLIDETIAERIPLASPTVDGARELVERWNALAAELKLPRCAKLNPALRSKLNARIKDDALLVRFDLLAAAVRASKFHRGDNDRGWRANPQWLATPGKAASLIAQHEAAGSQTAAQARAAMPVEALAADHARVVAQQTAQRKADDGERERILREDAETRARVLRLPQGQRDSLRAEILRGWPPMLARSEPSEGYSRSMIAEMARRTR